MKRKSNDYFGQRVEMKRLSEAGGQQEEGGVNKTQVEQVSSSHAWIIQRQGAISHHQQGRIDFNTVNPSLSTGKDFLIHSL